MDCILHPSGLHMLGDYSRGVETLVGLKETRMGKFKMGMLVASHDVYNLAGANETFKDFVNKSIARHSQGDWGELDEDDKKENEFSLENGNRLLSAYSYYDEKDNKTYKIWIITEADRSSTTVLFPHEY